MATDYSIWAIAYTRSNMPRDFFGGTLLESNQGNVRNPMVYTALHGGPDGEARSLILVDTGMKGGWSPSGKGYEGVEHPETTLAKIGFTPDDVETVILTHLHFDHAGNLDMEMGQYVETVILTHLHFDHAGNLDRFPNARFLVQRAEYDGWKKVFEMPDGLGSDTRKWPLSSINPDDFVELDRLIDQGRVAFLEGDAEIAPGINAHLARDSHTMGSQWLEVETRSGPYVIAGDCIYWYSNIERMWPPAYIQGDAWNLIEAYQKIRAAVGGDIDRIVPGHDPALFERHPTWTEGINPIAEVHLAAGVAPRAEG